MRESLTTRTCVVAILLAAPLASQVGADVATASGEAGQPALAAAPTGPAAPPEAAGPASSADPVARVNGRPVSRDRLDRLLVEAYGRQMLQSIVALAVVAQHAEAKKITVSPADVAAEEAASCPKELKDLSPAERDRLLDEYLDRNGLTRVHWRLAMRRNAYLRKLALAQKVPAPKDHELQELFHRTYGAKVEVRHIQVDSAADMRKARSRLEKGDPFEEVAQQMSTNLRAAARGGLLNPFDIKAPSVPEEIRQVAFGLEKPGQISGQILVRGHYHLLQLVRRIPPQDVKFEDVKADLARRMRDQMVRMQMNYLLRSLPAAAKIEILDPVIKRQAERAEPTSPAPTLPGGGEDKSPPPR